MTGMALESVNNLWGRTVNPFNTKLAAGGSSGGCGACVAMRGAAIAPMTDIGGSIRAPAAFNGLYAIRPTGARIPKYGQHSWVPGQGAIQVSVGPGCHSMEDLKLFSKIVNGHPEAGFDVSYVPVPWREISQPPSAKLSFGVFWTDEVVTPHPPIQRALRETIEKLKAAGHEGACNFGILGRGMETYYRPSV